MHIVYLVIPLVSMNNPDKPFPVKLGGKKSFLREEALEKDRSLHYLINKILERHLDENGSIEWKQYKLNIAKTKRTS